MSGIRVALRGPLALAMLLLACRAGAQVGLLPANDAGLRADVLLLADEGVINLPTNAWPIPVGDVGRAVSRARIEDFAEPALQAALLRVRKRVDIPTQEWDLHEVSVTAGEPGLLRGYETRGRDELELSTSGGAAGDSWGLTLTATGVASPADGHHLRLDGSNASLRWGNWLFSANQIDRWWGPGWDGSLILSTNARPMPAISLDRLQSSPFDFPILRWLGPWRFSAFLAKMEQHRPDVDRPLFMGMRVSFKPAQILELGLSRTAQFCGRGRPCGGSTFWDVLVGNDNVGFRVSPEDEPGNQMAGMDIRVVSPMRALPVALYGQFIGEDNSTSGIPERYLGQMGLEGWTMMDSGSSLRWRFEYANTNCKFAHPGSNLNCAYRQGIFRAGYRYRGRNIGHTVDSDSETVSAAIDLRRADGETFSLVARRALLDRYGGPDDYNGVTRGPGKVESVELGWQGAMLGQDVTASFGMERRDLSGLGMDSHPFGTIQWRRAF